jgi:hypothetical protein
LNIFAEILRRNETGVYTRLIAASGIYDVYKCKKPANSLRRLSNLNTNFTKLHNNRVKLQTWSGFKFKKYTPHIFITQNYED